MRKLIVATALFLMVPCTMTREACCAFDKTFGGNFTGQFTVKVGGFLSRGFMDGASYLTDRNVTACTLPAQRGANTPLAVHVANAYMDEYLFVGILKTGAWLINDIDDDEYESYTGRCATCCCNLCGRQM
ncbi:hypothetical protein GCK32_009829 [Trichostrongylus colubriformis]|uniref:Uncharacterized protein n=1 Tax=Trichostrongylus colubriformis TaxID=6319 RepID=A0AAN8F1K1_TRICO